MGAIRAVPLSQMERKRFVGLDARAEEDQADPGRRRPDPDRESTEDGGDAPDQVADRVAGAHSLSEVEQRDAAADLEGGDEDVERQTVLGRMLPQPLTNLIVHRRLRLRPRPKCTSAHHDRGADSPRWESVLDRTLLRRVQDCSSPSRRGPTPSGTR